MEFTTNKKFNKRFKKLDYKIREEFKRRREIFRTDPKHPLLNVHKLHGEFTGMLSMNIKGDYRAVFDVIGRNTVIFVDIGTHTELYE